MNERPVHRSVRPGPGWLQRAMIWPIRSLKVLLVGVTTCGLGWFWLAFYLYVEWRRRRWPRHPRETQNQTRN